MRLIFDSNVLISALLSDSSAPGTALLKAKSSSSILLISNLTLLELMGTLMRPKFDRYVSVEIRRSFVEEIKSLSLKVEITEQVQLCRDPKDDMYLELALSGNADCIITGDRDLLALNPFENIPIITPVEFLGKF